jgi:hypothetical protein
MENGISAGTALTASLHREFSVNCLQTILEIAPVMLLPGLHVNFECGLGAFRASSNFTRS